MVDIPVEELAIIFIADIDEEGFVEEIPLEVVEGYYNEEDERFIDTNFYSYAHLTNLQEGKAFACRLNINELLINYPDKSLNEIKNIVLEKYSNKRYEIGYFQDEPVILTTNIETGERTILMDVNTIENLMFLYDDQELEDMMMLFEEEDNKSVSESSSKREEVKNKKTEINPHKLYKEIKKTVKGQDEAIKKIVTTIWKNYSGYDKSNNMIVVGSSGVGKTEIFRQIAKILDIPLLIVSVAGMSQAGYKGTGTDEILSNLLTLTKGNVEKAEKAIVMLDEFDKLAYTGGDSGRISTMGVQNELLKIVEDGTFVVEVYENGFPVKKMIDTSGITFVGVGAFIDCLTVRKSGQLGFGNDIQSKEVAKEVITPEDLVGIKPELVGRMGMGGIIKLNDLDLEVMKDIIKNSSKSTYYSNVKFIEKQIPKFTRINEEEIIEAIAKKTLENKNKTGARGLSSIIENIFSELMFDIGDLEEHYNELVITKEIVNNPKKYVLKKD